jgi:hypothetical protein
VNDGLHGDLKILCEETRSLCKAASTAPFASFLGDCYMGRDWGGALKAILVREPAADLAASVGPCLLLLAEFARTHPDRGEIFEAFFALSHDALRHSSVPGAMMGSAMLSIASARREFRPAEIAWFVLCGFRTCTSLAIERLVERGYFPDEETIEEAARIVQSKAASWEKAPRTRMFATFRRHWDAMRLRRALQASGPPAGRGRTRARSGL